MRTRGPFPLACFFWASFYFFPFSFFFLFFFAANSLVCRLAVFFRPRVYCGSSHGPITLLYLQCTSLSRSL